MCFRSSTPAPVFPDTPPLFPSSSFALQTISVSFCTNPGGYLPSSDSTMRRSHKLDLSKARLIPTSSIASTDSLIPAVSKIVTGNPRKSSFTSIISLVVPLISDVIAASLPTRKFNKVDLPRFGAPTIATSKPALILSAV